jgi:hypothetical protein
MDLERLYKIIRETTQEYRKGMETTVKESSELVVVEHYHMPHQTEATAGLELVDVHFMVVGVDKEKAKQVKPELVEILKTYPDQPRFMQGLSYIEVGGEIGDQGMALRLFALGKSLGLWDIITPESLGVTGQEAHSLAGMGFVMLDDVNLEA